MIKGSEWRKLDCLLEEYSFFFLQIIVVSLDLNLEMDETYKQWIREVVSKAAVGDVKPVHWPKLVIPALDLLKWHT